MGGHTVSLDILECGVTAAMFLGCVLLVNTLNLKITGEAARHSVRLFFSSNELCAAGNRRNVFHLLAALLPLLGFLCLPVGNLPPLLNTPWSGVLCLGLLFGGMAFGLASQGISLPVYRSCAIPATFALVVLCVAAVYMWARGVPGSPLNFGSYVAMPLWGIMGVMGRVGLVCLFMSLWLVTPPLRGMADGREAEYTGLTLPESLTRLLFFSILVVLFVPWGSVVLFTVSIVQFFVVDFFVFWIKVLFLSLLYASTCNRQRNKFYSIAWLALILGSVLVLFDLFLVLFFPIPLLIDIG